MSKAHSRHTLAQHPFFSCNPQQESLFAVREGVPVLDGLNMASALINSADFVAILAAEAGAEDAMWATHYLIEMAYAVLGAAVETLSKEEARHV